MISQYLFWLSSVMKCPLLIPALVKEKGIGLVFCELSENTHPWLLSLILAPPLSVCMIL